jgi:prevent-host-death family protein
VCPYVRLTNLTNSGHRPTIVRMAKILNLYEAKSRLSALVEEAAAGEEVIIAKAGVPRARLVAVKSRVRRRPGGSKGRVRIAADFDAPLPASILAAFTGRKR